jgi:hypothetical protein
LPEVIKEFRITGNVGKVSVTLGIIGYTYIRVVNVETNAFILRWADLLK